MEFQDDLTAKHESAARSLFNAIHAFMREDIEEITERRRIGVDADNSTDIAHSRRFRAR